MRTSIIILVVMTTTVASQSTTDSPRKNICENCPPGQRGFKGVKGKRGSSGLRGEPGEPGRVFYRGDGLQCGGGRCPTGAPGDRGDIGRPGPGGIPGEPGPVGVKGRTGDIGRPGMPGRPGVQSGDVMYLPYKPGNDVGQVCYSFRKICIVPGLRNGWRGWYREGQSGYMIYKKWMYFVTLSACPCDYNQPSPPQPEKPSDCVRLGKCQTLD